MKIEKELCTSCNKYPCATYQMLLVVARKLDSGEFKRQLETTNRSGRVSVNIETCPEYESMYEERSVKSNE